MFKDALHQELDRNLEIALDLYRKSTREAYVESDSLKNKRFIEIYKIVCKESRKDYE